MAAPCSDRFFLQDVGRTSTRADYGRWCRRRLLAAVRKVDFTHLAGRSRDPLVQDPMDRAHCRGGLGSRMKEWAALLFSHLHSAAITVSSPPLPTPFPLLPHPTPTWNPIVAFDGCPDARCRSTCGICPFISPSFLNLGCTGSHPSRHPAPSPNDDRRLPRLPTH